MPAYYTPEGFDRWLAWDTGARQRASEYWRKHIESDPNLERAYVTVELILGGRTILLARDTIKTTRSSTGEVMNYAPGLVSEPAISQSIQLGNQAASARSVSVELPAWIIKPSEAIANGYILAGLGEVALQLDGGDYDLRLVLLRGSVTGGLAFGDDGEIVSIAISDLRDLQERKVPPWIVDETAWPIASDAAVGTRIPRIYNGCTAMPVQRVVDSHGVSGLIMGLNDTPGQFDVDTLYVNGVAKATGDSVYSWSQTTLGDGYGRVTDVTNQSGSSGPWEENDAVNVTMSRASGVAAKGVLTIAKELLAEFTSLGPLGINLDLFSYAETRIDSTAPNVVINASGQDTPGILAFIEGGLLDSYPMIHLAYSGAGIGATIIDRRTGAGGQGITGGKVIGRQFPLYERVSMYQETPKSELYTDFEVRYALNPMEQSYAGVLTRTPDTSVACALAERAIGGRRPFDIIESPYITSEKEAAYSIDWLVAHRTIPSYAVQWACSPWVHLRYRVGENVKYTDPRFPVFTDCVATIVDLGFERGKHTINFIVWHPVLVLSFTSGAAS